MATMHNGTILREIDHLFGVGTVAGLSDAQLLERFRRQQDEAAFTALVARHGSMVWAVCRGILRDAHAAEDAFQATFLILVRRAGTLWVDESLGGWLHRVAHRVALQARSDALRRRQREQKAGAAAMERRQDDGRDELRAVLHTEIGRLPDRLRLPLVLCDLEGLTRDQAAERLRWTEGTVRGRLARARELLRQRLRRRGAVVPAGAVAAALTREGTAAAIPAAVAIGAIRAAAGQAAGASVARLAAQVVRTMLFGTLKAAALLGLGIAVLATLGVCLAPGGAEEKVKPQTPGAATAPPVAQAATPRREEPGAAVSVRGRVVDPQGRPAAQAKVRFHDPWRHVNTGMPTAACGSDGRFVLTVPRVAADGPTPAMAAVLKSRVIASAPGFGFAWADVAPAPDGPAELTLRLVADDVPIQGRLVDLEGRPVTGAVARVREVCFPRKGDLSEWIQELRLGTNLGYATLDNVPLEMTSTTGPDGRFTLRGIGPERVAVIVATGPGIESAQLIVMTRLEPEIQPARSLWPGEHGYFAARFEHALSPDRVIAGVVRDRATGAPLGGVKLTGVDYDEVSRVPQAGVEATTDGNGRYRLTGLSPAHTYRLFARPAAGSPYPGAVLRVPAGGPAGPEPVAFDLGLQRGVLVQGRVTDKATGKPVRGYAETLTFHDNPVLKDFPGYRDILAPATQLDADGRFALIALPGRGLVAVRSDLAPPLGPVIENIKDLERWRMSSPTSPANGTGKDFRTFVEINPGAESQSLSVALQVEPEHLLEGMVFDPDSEPIGGSRCAGLSDQLRGTYQTLESPLFVVRGLDSGTARRLVFLHDERKLAGSILVGRNETEPPLVTLEAWGTVTGRLVDEHGVPRTNVKLLASVIDGLPEDPERPSLPSVEAASGGNGRFRLEGLVPDLNYELKASEGGGVPGVIFKEIQVSPGETRDLGDVKAIARPD